jgi:hypothetical protein
MKFKNFLVKYKQTDEEEHRKKGYTRGSIGGRSISPVAKALASQGHINFKMAGKPQLVSLNTSITNDDDNDTTDNLIKEKFFNSFHAGMTKKHKGGYTEVFKDPNSVEIKRIMTDSKLNLLNFLIDFDKKNIYCFKADTDHFELTHDFLKHNEVKINLKDYVQGIADYDNKLSINKIIAHHITTDEIDWLKSWFDDKSMKEFASMVKE